MIESHVTNYELSKRLHELGVSKPSIFSWSYICLPGESIVEGKHMVILTKEKPKISLNKISAYIASELLEMLPARLYNPIDNYPNLDFTLSKYYEDDSYLINYFVYDRIVPFIGISKNTIKDKNASNVLAKMLIYLIENKLVSVEEINK